MTEREKQISGMKDRILVEANVGIFELGAGNYTILLDKEHHLCFRTTVESTNVAFEKLIKVVESDRLSIVKL